MLIGKKRKIIKIILIALIVYVAVICSDFILSRFNKRPIFAIPVNTYKDGGSKEYFGLGYKIIKYNKLDIYDSECLDSYKLDHPNIEEIKYEDTGCSKTVSRQDSVFGFWNLKYK